MSEFSGSAPNPTRGNMKNDQIFCNAVAIGCSNPNDNTNNESRLVVKRQRQKFTQGETLSWLKVPVLKMN